MRALQVMLALAGMTFPLDAVFIQQALSIANSSVESDHRRFHADYVFQVNSAPVDVIGLVTPFRRVVLTAETAARHGGHRYGQREALEALQPQPDRLEVYAELTFHPHHTFVGVPEYTVVLEPRSGARSAIAPRDIERIPRFTSRMDAPWYPFAYPFGGAPRLPSRTDTLLGGTLIARFSADDIDGRGAYIVTVADGARALARVQIDLIRVR